MSTRDAVGNHIVAFSQDGKMAASATLIPITKFGTEHRSSLPYFVHTENAPERFLDFSQYFTSAQNDPQMALESLMKYAVEIALQQKISCVAAVVPNEWFDLFERISTIPHVVERTTPSQGSPSVFYFLVGEAGERFTQSVHRKEFQSHTGEATFSRVFRTFIEKKD